MIKDFTTEKKEELYRVLDVIDNKEWESFMAWCGPRVGEFGEWADRLGIVSYMSPSHKYQQDILDTNESIRTQINTVFENVAEIDKGYAEIFHGHVVTVRRQIAVVQELAKAMQYARKTGTEINVTAYRRDSQVGISREEPLINGQQVLLGYLKSRGIKDPAEQERIYEVIMKNQPDILENRRFANSYSEDYNEACNELMNYCRNHYFGEYPYPVAYIEGIIKDYEKHKMENGRFVVDGKTIGYGHDIQKGEDFSNGLSEEEALKLAISDLDKKYADIMRRIQKINEITGQNIEWKDFSENEMIFFLDFEYNRGRGLKKRSKSSEGDLTYSIDLLIMAVWKMNNTANGDEEEYDKEIISILKEEMCNEDGVYYKGLERRRMDEYEILKKGEYKRNDDMERGVW